jgi:WD40 repeat protein
MSVLSIKHEFGLVTSLSNCIYYFDEYCYLYPSNRHIILYNNDYKVQRLINYGNEFDTLKLLSLSPNKQLLSIVLNTIEKCRILIYDINGGVREAARKRKVLSLGHKIRSIDVLSVVFSPNSKYVVAL